MALLSISLMIIMNVGFMLWTAIQNCKAKRIAKVIEARKTVLQTYEQAKDQILANKSTLQQDLSSIAESVNEDGSSQQKSCGGNSVAKKPLGLNHEE